MPKSDVRKIAAELGLIVAAKPDSQDICFVSGGNYASIVEKLKPDAAKPGDVVDQNGKVLARHEGVIHFTVGQRKGLGLSGNEEPLFVLKIDAAKARVIVGPRSALATSTFSLREVNWLAPKTDTFLCAVKTRSMRPPVAARVTPKGEGATVELLHPEDAVAPGQACVFYDGGRVLGGGWIVQNDIAALAAE
jgi:tRNA-specific 2-thiouridylase